MKIFKWRHFNSVIILYCLRLHFSHGVNCRQLERMMHKRGVSVNYATIYRWIKTYGCELNRGVPLYPKSQGLFWHIEETRTRIKGTWKYLYRAIDEQGDTIDFYLSPTRNVESVKEILSQISLMIKEYKV